MAKVDLSNVKIILQNLGWMLICHSNTKHAMYNICHQNTTYSSILNYMISHYYIVLQSSFADPLLMECLLTSSPFPSLPPLKLLLLKTSFPLKRIYDHWSKVVQRGSPGSSFSLTHRMCTCHRISYLVS